MHFEKADLRWQLLRRPVATSDFCFASEAGMLEQKVELNGIEDENIIYVFIFWEWFIYNLKLWNNLKSIKHAG